MDDSFGGPQSEFYRAGRNATNYFMELTGGILLHPSRRGSSDVGSPLKVRHLLHLDQACTLMLGQDFCEAMGRDLFGWVS